MVEWACETMVSRDEASCPWRVVGGRFVREASALRDSSIADVISVVACLICVACSSEGASAECSVEELFGEMRVWCDASVLSAAGLDDVALLRDALDARLFREDWFMWTDGVLQSI